MTRGRWDFGTRGASTGRGVHRARDCGIESRLIECLLIRTVEPLTGEGKGGKLDARERLAATRKTTKRERKRKKKTVSDIRYSEREIYREVSSKQ